MASGVVRKGILLQVWNRTDGFTPWPKDTARYYIVPDFTVGVDAAQAAFAQLKTGPMMIKTTATIPPPPSGGGDWVVIGTSVGISLPTQTLMAVANIDVFEPDIQWQKINGIWRARVKNKRPMNGNWTVIYSGMPKLPAFGDDYVWQDGDYTECEIVNVAPSVDVFSRGNALVGNALIYFVQPTT